MTTAKKAKTAKTKKPVATKKVTKATPPKTNDLRENGSTMRGIDFKVVSIVNFTHSFSNELLTATRTNRDANHPYAVALVVCYQSGDFGVWRFYSERRRSAMVKEQRMLIRQTENETPGYAHMLGATILELPTELGKIEDQKAEKIAKQAEKIALLASVAGEVFESKKEAIQRAKELGIAQKHAVKNDDAQWTLATV